MYTICKENVYKKFHFENFNFGNSWLTLEHVFTSVTLYSMPWCPHSGAGACESVFVSPSWSTQQVAAVTVPFPNPSPPGRGYYVTANDLHIYYHYALRGATFLPLHHGVKGSIP